MVSRSEETRRATSSCWCTESCSNLLRRSPSRTPRLMARETVSFRTVLCCAATEVRHSIDEKGKREYIPIASWIQAGKVWDMTSESRLDKLKPFINQFFYRHQRPERAIVGSCGEVSDALLRSMHQDPYLIVCIQSWPRPSPKLASHTAQRTRLHLSCGTRYDTKVFVQLEIQCLK